ncbi:MAG: hypothetical protein JXB32_12415 [Deltaproteobacteria bacterium]|nr:hypothetical protein [Deltaproteobacteria bacterium]
MTEHELTAKAALRALDRPPEGGAQGRLGLVAARAGTGKTALLVQLGLDALLRGLPVLHVAVGETLAHVKRWYDGVYRDLAVSLSAAEARAVWERLEPRRLLMAFRAEAFTAERLVDRMRLLEAQGVFAPRVLAVDGLALEPELRDAAETLGRLAAERGLDVWLAARTPDENGDVDREAAATVGLCALAVALEPRGDGVALRWLRAPSGAVPRLRLDPGTLLVRPAERAT